MKIQVLLEDGRNQVESWFLSLIFGRLGRLLLYVRPVERRNVPCALSIP
jgi:hypothetical protein